jgi:hypothetical protein
MINIRQCTVSKRLFTTQTAQQTDGIYYCCLSPRSHHDRTLLEQMEDLISMVHSFFFHLCSLTLFLFSLSILPLFSLLVFSLYPVYFYVLNSLFSLSNLPIYHSTLKAKLQPDESSRKLSNEILYIPCHFMASTFLCCRR